MKGIQPCSLERVHLFKQTVCTKSEGIVQPLPWGIVKECCVQAEQEADRFCQMDFMANGKHSHSSTPTKFLTSTSSIDYRLPKLHFRFCSRSPCGSQTCCHHFCWHDGLRWSSNFLMKNHWGNQTSQRIGIAAMAEATQRGRNGEVGGHSCPSVEGSASQIALNALISPSTVCISFFLVVGWNSNGLCLFQQKVVWTQSYSCDSRILIEIQMINDLLYTFIIPAMFT